MRTTLLAILAAVVLIGCGSSSDSSSSSSTSAATTVGNGTSASSASASSGSTASTATSASSSGGTSASSSSSGTASASTSTSTGSTSGSGSSGSSTGASTGSASTGGSGGAIVAPANAWTWVDIAGAVCRDGSPTGIGVNLNPSSSKVMIFLEGGGACFSYGTCGLNPSTYGADQFDGGAIVTSLGGSGVATPKYGNGGIADRSNAANPVGDWSYVYVPYCTGDVHAGNNPAGAVTDVSGTQQFVGYANMQLYLQRLVPTFPNATQVLLTGASAGGFGAAANYDQVAAAFAPVPVQMVDDSGPLMADPYLPSCMQDLVRQLWGLDSTLLADCGSDCTQTNNYMSDYAAHVVATHPTQQFGLIESTDDQTITQFFAQGENNCASITFGTLDHEDGGFFEAGLDSIRTNLAGDTNFGAFYFSGTEHTSLEADTFYTRTAGGVALNDWVGALIDGGVSNVGP